MKVSWSYDRGDRRESHSTAETDATALGSLLHDIQQRAEPVVVTIYGAGPDSPDELTPGLQLGLGHPYSASDAFLRPGEDEAMKGYHTRWTVPDEHRASPEYVEAGARIALGQAVYDRRVALGLSQAELAARAGTTQTVISRLEGGAVTPTLPLLHRLAGALEGELDIKTTGTSTRAEFPLASCPAGPRQT